MIANSIEKTLQANDLSACLNTSATTVEVVEGSNSTVVDCVGVKVEIALTLAFTSGLVMVRPLWVSS